SAAVRERVQSAQKIQRERQSKLNATLKSREIEAFCKITPLDAILLEEAIDKFGLSARSYHRILKVARTMADLENATLIKTQHLKEALGYRCLDRRHQRVGANF
ncbi:hypothetical protein EBR66_08660, partial [bacterium]|nr:hypothetical protein [bacterium]